MSKRRAKSVRKAWLVSDCIMCLSANSIPKHHSPIFNCYFQISISPPFDSVGVMPEEPSPFRRTTDLPIYGVNPNSLFH